MEPFAPHSDDEQASGAHGELELGNVVVEESREPTPAPELQQLQQQDSAPQRIKPLILFDLNGVLINESDAAGRSRRRFYFRPELELLFLSLLPKYRIGIFSSATERTVLKGIGAIKSYLLSERFPAKPNLILPRKGIPFDVILHRDNCQPDPQWRSRPGGTSFDTVKPLATNGLDLRNTLLVDNEGTKACQGEELNLLLLPTWAACFDKGVATWRALMDQLTQIPQGCTDIRAYVQRINSHVQEVHTSTSGSPPASPGHTAAGTSNALRPEVAPLAAAAAAALQPLGGRRIVTLPLMPAVGPTAALAAADKQGQAAASGRALSAADGSGSEEDTGPGGGGKRMRTDGAQDVAQGVAPSIDLARYRQQQDEHDEGFPRGLSEPGASREARAHEAGTSAPSLLTNVQVEPAPVAPAGHKRGRQLPGAVPLYNGPRGAPSRHQSESLQHHGARRAPLSALHHEVATFAQRAMPSPSDLQLLSAVLAKVQEAASNLWPHAQVHLFGSQASGLALPCSDLDIVILGVIRDLDTPAQGFSNREKVQAVDCLRALAKELRYLGVLRSKPEVIARAKVPIIKAWFGGLGNSAQPLPIDISIGVANGAAAVRMVQQAVVDLPPLRPLCLVLKALLRETGLNEVFQGGLSSYSLVNMVIAHLQCEGWDASKVAHVALTAVAPDGSGEGGMGALAQDQVRYLQSLSAAVHDGYDLGLLLTSFLERFGRTFDYQNEAVSIARGGITDKPHGWRQKGVMLLGVEDPQQVGRDIGLGSFNMHKVRQVFREALAALLDTGATSAPKHPASVPAAAPAAMRGNDGVRAPACGGASGSGSGSGDAEAQRRPVTDEEKWATIQRDGHCSSVELQEGAGPSAAASTGDAGAGGHGVRAPASEPEQGPEAGPGPGSVPWLLDHILDVKMALGRDVSQQQRQQVVPRLEQRQVWLRHQGLPTNGFTLGAGSTPAPGGKGKGSKSSAVKERSAKKAGKKGKRLQHEQGLGDAAPSHRATQAPAVRTGKDRYRLSKQQKARQGLDMLLDVNVASMSRAQGVQVAQDIRAGRGPRMSKNQTRVLRKQLQELGVNLTKADIARHRDGPKPAKAKKVKRERGSDFGEEEDGGVKHRKVHPARSPSARPGQGKAQGGAKGGGKARSQGKAAASGRHGRAAHDADGGRRHTRSKAHGGWVAV